MIKTARSLTRIMRHAGMDTLCAMQIQSESAVRTFAILYSAIENYSVTYFTMSSYFLITMCTSS